MRRIKKSGSLASGAVVISTFGISAGTAGGRGEGETVSSAKTEDPESQTENRRKPEAKMGYFMEAFRRYPRCYCSATRAQAKIRAEKGLLFDGSTRPPKLVAEMQNDGQIVRDAKTYEQIQQAIQTR